MTNMECRNAVFIGKYNDLLLIKENIIVSGRVLLYVELPKEVNAAFKLKEVRDHYSSRSLYGWPDKDDVDLRIFNNSCVLVVMNMNDKLTKKHLSICKKIHFKGLFLTTPFLPEQEEAPNLGLILELDKFNPAN